MRFSETLALGHFQKNVMTLVFVNVCGQTHIWPFSNMSGNINECESFLQFFICLCLGFCLPIRFVNTT